jgi:hypothetical protein
LGERALDRRRRLPRQLKQHAADRSDAYRFPSETATISRSPAPPPTAGPGTDAVSKPAGAPCPRERDCRSATWVSGAPRNSPL